MYLYVCSKCGKTFEINHELNNTYHFNFIDLGFDSSPFCNGKLEIVSEFEVDEDEGIHIPMRTM